MNAASLASLFRGVGGRFGLLSTATLRCKACWRAWGSVMGSEVKRWVQGGQNECDICDEEAEAGRSVVAMVWEQ